MDITIVCGRRPDLLAQTLASFHEKIIRHFDVGTVYANIDPFCGSDADGDACERLLRESFTTVVLRRPEVPSFGAAVKHLWQQPRSQYFLHMEDDWEVLHSVTPKHIEPRLQGQVVQVQLASRDRLYLPKKYAFYTTWRSILGIKFLKKVDVKRPEFATSPSFINSNFARRCAQLMDPRKDPEKQLFSVGSDLGQFTASFRNHPLQETGRRAIVRDLGRDWLQTHGLKKRTINGVSIWETTN
jgi:hypothetical protein